MKKLSFIVAIFIIGCMQAQRLEQKFDSILSAYHSDDKPGLAAGVIQNGELLYLKGFGVEDVETKKEISTKTKFQVDDLAKQFTVLGALILEQQGKLSFEDDIRKHIPTLSEYNHRVQIKHLIHHTSGLYNLDPIKELHQINANDTFTHEDALKLIFAQQQLNFQPGTQFSYHRSDTEVILLTEVIKQVTQLDFVDFMKQQVFEPLGMTNTAFQNNLEMLENQAKSYTVGDEISYNPRTDFSLGATNLFTTAEDLATWFQLYSQGGKFSTLIQTLDSYVQLDSGQQYDSTWGSMTLGRYYDHPERGLSKMSWQFGMVNGYGANFFRFQSHYVFSFVLGNNNRYNGMPTMLLANEIMEEHYLEPAEIDYSKVNFKKVSVKNLKKHEGFYWDQSNGLVRQIYVRDDTLRYKRLNGNRETALLPRSKTKFQLYISGDTEVFITFYKDRYEFSSLGSIPSVYDKINPIAKTELNHQEYTGLFYNKEFDLTLRFQVNNDELEASNFNLNPVSFYSIIRDNFRSNTFMLSGIKFLRNSTNEISGFEIHTDGITGLFFEKIQS